MYFSFKCVLSHILSYLFIFLFFVFCFFFVSTLCVLWDTEYHMKLNSRSYSAKRFENKNGLYINFVTANIISVCVLKSYTFFSLSFSFFDEMCSKKRIYRWKNKSRFCQFLCFFVSPKVTTQMYAQKFIRNLADLYFQWAVWQFFFFVRIISTYLNLRCIFFHLHWYCSLAVCNLHSEFNIWLI